MIIRYLKKKFASLSSGKTRFKLGAISAVLITSSSFAAGTFKK